MERIRKYRYSEIFGDTIQGEGEYTGIPTVWVRWWGCNFDCKGFGQKDLTDPSSWILPYEDIDASKYTEMKDLPVFNYGCDSSYSWAKKFSHMAHQETAEMIASELEHWLMTRHNPRGKFIHAKSGQSTHLAFTGGEPMMSQTAMVDVLGQLQKNNNLPRNLTIETNGTQQIREPFQQFMNPLTQDWSDGIQRKLELFWSLSPKLTASGEKWTDAIRPEIVKQYRELSDKGQLKYVVDGTQKVWDEVERATDLYRSVGIDFDVWIMPVGATREGQENIQAEICEEACRRGYNTAARLHCWIFGNSIGK